MPDELRLPVVLVVAALAALAGYAYWVREQRKQTKSDDRRRARLQHARDLIEPKEIAPPLKLKAQGFGRR